MRAESCGRTQAAHYLLNVDWLRVYNTNPTIANPDILLKDPNKIFIGPNYVVQPGDSLLEIAGETAMPSLRVQGFGFVQLGPLAFAISGAS
jgi:hypothetical protein